MANIRSVLICPKCDSKGGVLTIRKAGRVRVWKGKRYQQWHWYIGHYDPSKASRKRWCYIGSHDWDPLWRVRLAHPEYEKYLEQVPSFAEVRSKHSEYELEIERMKAGRPRWFDISGYDDAKYEEMRGKLVALLLEMGWPVKWADNKLGHDAERASLGKRYGLPRLERQTKDRYRPTP